MPTVPVMMKLARQPSCTMMSGTSTAVRMMPTLEPALNRPVAKLRSFRGNHSATVLMAAGKLPASPRPRRKRDTDMPPTELTRPWPAAATLQPAMLMV